MPAATVSFVASSTRMNAPVARFTAYGSTSSGPARRSRTARDVVQRRGRPPAPARASRRRATTSTSSRIARDQRVVCLMASRAPGLRPGARSSSRRSPRARAPPRAGRPGRRACRRAGTSTSSASRTTTDCPCTATSSGAVVRLDRRDGGARGRRAARRPRRRRATRRPRPGPRSRGSRGARRDIGRITHCTGKRRCAASRSPAISIVSRRSRNVPPSHQGIRSDGSTTLSPGSAAIGIATSSRTPSCSRERRRSSRSISRKRLLVEVDEVHLVDREDDVGDAERRGDERVPAGLLDHALARVEQDDGDVGGRGARDHVARVLDVARARRRAGSGASG